jgi:hypothetical protein
MGDSIWAWLTTAADNASSDDEINWAEGQLPSTVNNSARAMMRRISQLLGDLKGTIETGGTSNAFSITTNTVPDAITDGLICVIDFDRAPTGASTMNVDGKGAKALRDCSGAAISANDIDAGDRHVMIYDEDNDHYRLLTLDTRQLNDHDIGVTVQAYDSVLDATTASFTTAQETKLGYLTLTGAVDLDAINTRVTELDQAIILQGSFSPSGGAFPGGGTAQAGERWIADDAGTIDSVDFSAGDTITALTDNASTTTYSGNWLRVDNTEQDASETAKGVVELATDAETITGTDTARAVTPANLTAKLADIVEDTADFEAGVATDESTITAAKLAAAIAALETKTFVISGTIADSIATVVLDQKAQFSYDIESIAYVASSGSFDMDVEIDGTDVTSLSGLSVTTTEAESTATGANSVAVGQTVRLVFTGKADGEDLYFTMKCTRT